MTLNPEQREEFHVVGTGSQPSWRPRLRRLAAAAGGAALAAVFLVPANPAGAATTVAAQLTLSGVATASSPTGGTTVGVHPGDSVKISASSLPTAGAGPLSGLLSAIVNGVVGLEVDVTGLPGHSTPVKLSSPLLGVSGSRACPGTSTGVTLPALKKGTYKFTYTVKTANLLSILVGCNAPLKLNGSQIATLTHNGVAIDATNTYHGVIVVAQDPPAGGISIQLPGVTVSGHVGPVKLPSVNLPGVNLPTIPVVIPSVPSLDPTALAKARAAAAAAAKQALIRKSQQQAYDFSSLPLTIPELVVPGGSGGYVTPTGLGTDGSPNTVTGTDLPGGGPAQYVQAPVAGSSSPAGAGGGGGGAHSIRGSGTDLRYVNTAADPAPEQRSASLVPLIAVVAGIALIALACGFTTRRVLARIDANS